MAFEIGKCKRRHDERITQTLCGTITPWLSGKTLGESGAHHGLLHKAFTENLGACVLAPYNSISTLLLLVRPWEVI